MSSRTQCGNAVVTRPFLDLAVASPVRRGAFQPCGECDGTIESSAVCGGTWGCGVGRRGCHRRGGGIRVRSGTAVPDGARRVRVDRARDRQAQGEIGHAVGVAQRHGRRPAGGGDAGCPPGRRSGRRAHAGRPDPGAACQRHEFRGPGGRAQRRRRCRMGGRRPAPLHPGVTRQRSAVPRRSDDHHRAGGPGVWPVVPADAGHRFAGPRPRVQHQRRTGLGHHHRLEQHRDRRRRHRHHRAPGHRWIDAGRHRQQAVCRHVLGHDLGHALWL